MNSRDVDVSPLHYSIGRKHQKSWNFILVKNENEVALQRAEMRMVRWMCNFKVKDRVPSKELRERLGIDDILVILQQNRLRWYGHVLRKEDTDYGRHM